MLNKGFNALFETEPDRLIKFFLDTKDETTFELKVRMYYSFDQVTRTDFLNP